MIWNELVKIGLMGTDRSQLSPKVEKELEGMGISVTKDSAQTLLEGASIFALMRKSGGLLTTYSDTLPEKDSEEESIICPTRSIKHLHLILSGRYANALSEFMTALMDSGKTIPPEMLPDLLSQALTSNHWWQEIRPCIGARGEWLIQQNPEWEYLLKKVDLSFWETGKEAERLQLLEQVRTTNPKQAVELLSSSWKMESISSKKKFIQVLDHGLSKTDESFLESCLDESRKEIRRYAARLLARIPESAFVERMLERIRPLVAIKERLVKKKNLQVELPENFDESMIRDSIDPSAQWYRGGLKASRLGQMLTLIPPSKLEEQLALKGIELLNAMVRSEYAELLLQSMIESSALHDDANWRGLLLQFWIENYDKARWQELQPQELLSSITAEQLDQIGFKYLKIEKGVPDENTPLDFLLKNTTSKWSDRLGLLFIAKMQKWMVSEDARYWGGLHLRRILKSAAYKIDPKLYPQLSKGWPDNLNIWAGWEEDIGSFLTTLQFRAIMLETLEGEGN